MAEGERVLLEHGAVRVTTSRFVVGGQTYAVSAINSVAFTQNKPKTGGATGAIILGLLALLMSVPFFMTASRSDESLGCAWSAAVAGVLLFALGIAVHGAKGAFQVTLTTSSGQVQALTSKDREYIERVVKALNDAIVARG